MDNSTTRIHITSCPICSNHEFIPFLSCTDHFATQETFSLCECKKCGFTFTQDFPSDDEIGRYYDVPAYISHSDTAKGLINRLYHIARKSVLKSKAKIVKRYSSQPTGLLLDIGCGTGYFLNKMREQKWAVTGVEKSESARNYAKEKFGISSQDADYLQYIPHQSKDVVTMWHVLEHVEHLNETMARIHTILKDDGVAIIALPNRESFDAGYYKADWAAYDVPRHLWHFTATTLEHLATKHAFELVDTQPMYFDAMYISMMSEINRGSFLANVRGLAKGFIFAMRSVGKKERCSSLIYILKKRNTNV